ncbi:hypothetical protein ACXJY6_16795 [Vibrio sp. RC27]
MDVAKADNTIANTPSILKPKVSPETPDKATLLESVTKVEANKVTLSEEGKALLSALQDIESNEVKTNAKDKTVGDKVESFTYGALGMEHPKKLEEEKDDSYSAGQYLSGAATIGTILLALA